MLLVYGGQSSEHAVSIQSAKSVYANLDTQRFKVIPCYIDQNGAWWRTDGISANTATATPVQPVIGRPEVRIDEESVRIDVLFPVLHGQYGEDGSIQGLAKLMHLPLVGCGIDASAICMDKIITKKILQNAGIPIVPYAEYYAGSERPAYDLLRTTLSETVFVKPARAGSSVGVSKVTSAESFAQALDKALHHDSSILIEQGLTVREIEVAVLGDTSGPRASTIGEIVPDRDFYSYESKYDPASTSAIQIPAKLPDQMAAQIASFAQQAFTLLRCQGLARIDFFVTRDGKIYLNEVNTMPGFTDISMYPKLWEASGKPYKQLLTELVELAR